MPEFTREERLTAFFNKIVETQSGCHIFIGGRNNEGYGNFWDNGVCKKAHRFAYECWYGPIPSGKLVLHKCDNPPCCNPYHLYLGTDADNTIDKLKRGRMASVAGANNPSAFITEKEVRDIYAHLHYTDMTQQEIADKFGLTKGHINNIKAGRVWNHIYKESHDATFTD